MITRNSFYKKNLLLYSKYFLYIELWCSACLICVSLDLKLRNLVDASNDA